MHFEVQTTDERNRSQLVAALEKIFEPCEKCASSSDKILVAVDPAPSYVRRLRSANFAHKFLVCIEPPSIAPLIRTEKVRRMFDEVFVQTPEQKVEHSDLVWSFGHFVEYLDEAPFPHVRKLKCCMVNSAKTSFVRGSWYPAREEIALQLAEEGLLDLYGRGWGLPIHKMLIAAAKCLVFDSLMQRQVPVLANFSISRWRRLSKFWLGECRNPIETYAQYEFALIVENDGTYFSEKLINALRAGAVPLFAGAQRFENTLLEQSVIRLPKEVDSWKEFLAGVNIQRFRENGARFLREVGPTLLERAAWSVLAEEIHRRLHIRTQSIP